MVRKYVMRGGGMPTGCTRGALRRVCRARTWSHRFCWHAQDAMYTVVRAASDEMEVSRAREPYVRYVASRGLRTYGPWSTLDGSAPLSGKLC